MRNEFEKLFVETKQLKDMVESAKVVVDTNVLLSAYQTKPLTFKAIFDVLKDLADKGRLVIPNHVMFEFSKNRPDQIKEISNNLHQYADGMEKFINPQRPKELENIFPGIEVLEDKNIVDEIQKDFNLKLKELKTVSQNFKEKLVELSNKIGNYIDSDPILLEYKEILSKSQIDAKLEINDEQLESIGRERYKKGMPPGFKDNAKDFNKYGDLKIWLEICELKHDLIFITFDNKPDWVYKDVKGNVLGAKRELCLEYYEKSDGKTFKILHPGTFIELYTKGQMDSKVKEELNDYKRVIKPPAIINYEETINKSVKRKEEMLLAFRIKGLESQIEELFNKIRKIIPDERIEEFIILEDKYGVTNLVFVSNTTNSLGVKIGYETQLTDILLDLKRLYEEILSEL